MPKLGSELMSKLSVHTKFNLQAWLHAHRMAFLLGFRNLAKTPFTTLFTVMAISACLVLPMSIHLMVKNVQIMAQGMSAHCALSLFTNSDATSSQIDHIIQHIQPYSFVKETQILSPEQALSEFKQHSNLADAIDLLPSNPLPGVIQIQLYNQPIEKALLQQFKQELLALPGSMHAEFDFEWIHKLNAILAFSSRLTTLLYGLMGLGITLIIGNTLRLALEQHREEMLVLSLVGATRSYIRRPFLYRGLFYGALGGIIACLLLSLLLWMLSTPLHQFIASFSAQIHFANLSFFDTVTFLVTSTALGWLAAVLTFKQQHILIESHFTN